MTLYKSIGLVGVFLLTSCAVKAPNYDALYQERFAQLKANGGLMKEYTPSEAVMGDENYAPLPLASEVSIPSDVLLKADNYAQERNSFALMVWQNGKIIHQRFFGDNKADTPMVSRSLSKPLTAIAVGRAIALGAIKSLDQPVSDFIPQWKNTPKSSILVRHLLDMHAGFQKQGYSLDPNNTMNTAYLSYEHEKVLINDYPLVHKPGELYSYNNATADMVALVIEAATGRRYADFIGNEILSEIGAEGGTLWLNREGGVAHSACCMKFPAETYLRLALLVSNDGKVGDKQLLPTGFVQQMKTPSATNKHFGLGIWLGQPYQERRGYTGEGGGGPQVLHSEPYTDKSLYLFDGSHNQVIYIMPENNMLIMRLGTKPPKDLEWDNSYLPNLFVGALNSHSK